MLVSRLWSEKSSTSAYSAAVAGHLTILGCENRVHLKTTEDGGLRANLTGHREKVVSIAVSSDGKRFASGDAEGTVIIWKCNGEGLVKYSHSSAVRALSFNPMSNQLSSASMSEIGVWSFDQRAVDKIKTDSAILCIAWSPCGEWLVAGSVDGSLKAYNRGRTEKWSTRPHGEAFFPYCLKVTSSTITLGSWSRGTNRGRITTMNLVTRNEEKFCDLELEYQPTCISAMPAGPLLIIAGTRGRIDLIDRNSILMTLIDSGPQVWILALTAVQDDRFVYTTSDGDAVCVSVKPGVVHAIHKTKYAVRDPETLTDVVVMDLVHPNPLIVLTNDIVDRVSVYESRVALQSHQSVFIYALADSSLVSSFTLTSSDCSLLLLTSLHVVTCTEQRVVSALSLSGKVERFWKLSAPVRYMKIIDGPSGKECILAGLADGAVDKIFVSEQHVHNLINHPTGIRCVDMNLRKSLLAVIDEVSCVTVYETHSGKSVYSSHPAVSASFNGLHPSMLACSATHDHLSIVRISESGYEVFTQAVEGLVVGFHGNQAFLLRKGKVESIGINFSPIVDSLLKTLDLTGAFKVACLGVSSPTWRRIGEVALQVRSLSIARDAYLHVQDFNKIDLVDIIATHPDVLATQFRPSDREFELHTASPEWSSPDVGLISATHTP